MLHRPFSTCSVITIDNKLDVRQMIANINSTVDCLAIVYSTKWLLYLPPKIGVFILSESREVF